MKFTSSEIVGCGYYLPEHILTNDDLSKMVDTSDEWIFSRTGIKQRHIAADDELTSDLAVKAAERAINSSKILPEDIDLVIVATITPDNTTPSVSCKVAQKLGLKNGTPAFDISAACSGFVYAMSIADSMIKNGLARNALLIGAETLSRIIDWQDRNTCVLFGDGAGAFVLRGKESKDKLNSEIISSSIFADGSKYDDLRTTGGVSSTKDAGILLMNGKEVFKIAVHSLASGAQSVLEKAEMSISDVDWLLPHQANSRIIEATGKMLEIRDEKIILSIGETGNTSAASIPLSFAQCVEEKKIKKGDVVLMTAMGAGFTWGAVLVRY